VFNSSVGKQPYLVEDGDAEAEEADDADAEEADDADAEAEDAVVELLIFELD